jgi:Peptidase family M28/PA domain
MDAGRRFVVFLAVLIAVAVAAGPASAGLGNDTSSELRRAVSAAGIMQHEAAFQLIGDVANGNRLSGTPGYDASALYVRAAARLSGYSVSVQNFDYELDFLADYKAPILAVTRGDRRALVPGIAGALFGGDFGSMYASPSGDLRDRQIFAADLSLPPGPPNTSDSGCEPADFEGMEAGAIVLLQRGTCGILTKWINAQDAGAGGIVWINEGQQNDPDRCCPQWYDVTGAGLTVPMVAATVDAVENLRNGVLQGPTGERGRLRVDWRPGTYPSQNVIAETRGGDPDNVIVVGAHLDSVGVGPGINDNGSGSAGILEIARQLRGVYPRNKIRFIWFGAEESGLLGSEEYVASLSPEERDRIAAMLNFDMIGSPNFVRFVYDGNTDETPPPAGGAPAGSDEIEQLFLDYFADRGLETEPTAFDGRSDYGPFIAPAVGIPAGGLFTGAEGIKTPEEAAIYGGVAGEQYDPCYHLGCDRLTNLSRTALEQMGDAAAHATITLAQSDDLPGPAAAARSGAGAQALRSAGARHDALNGARPMSIGDGAR